MITKRTAEGNIRTILRRRKKGTQEDQQVGDITEALEFVRNQLDGRGVLGDDGLPVSKPPSKDGSQK